MKKSTCSDGGGGADVAMVTSKGYNTSAAASVFVPVKSNVKSILSVCVEAFISLLILFWGVCVTLAAFVISDSLTSSAFFNMNTLKIATGEAPRLEIAEAIPDKQSRTSSGTQQKSHRASGSASFRLSRTRTLIGPEQTLYREEDPRN